MALWFLAPPVVALPSRAVDCAAQAGGVSGAEAARAAMDADHASNATGTARRHRRRALIL
ncbi:hypothetical protein GCM10027436_69140 [Actinophytocola sediminis]